MKWIHRIFIFCYQEDLTTLRDVAVATTHNQADIYSFVHMKDNIYGCSTAATEEIRRSLNNIIIDVVNSGQLKSPIYISRMDYDYINQSSYSITPSGIEPWGVESGVQWNVLEALSLI